MKKLDIALGGHPLAGDDLLFLQSSITEGLTALAAGLGGSLFIISGVEITVAAGTITWTAGWMYINGEICQVDSGSATLASNNTFTIVQTYDSAGNVVYEDLTTKDTYLIRKATISGTAGGANVYTNARRLSNYNDRSGTTLLGSWAAPGAAPVVYKDITGATRFTGAVQATSYSSGTDSIITTLATQYRPDTLRRVIAPALIGSSVTLVHLTIDTNGDVSPLGLTTGNNVTIYLDGISFTRTFTGA